MNTFDDDNVSQTCVEPKFLGDSIDFVQTIVIFALIGVTSVAEHNLWFHLLKTVDNSLKSSTSLSVDLQNNTRPSFFATGKRRTFSPTSPASEVKIAPSDAAASQTISAAGVFDPTTVLIGAVSFYKHLYDSSRYHTCYNVVHTHPDGLQRIVRLSNCSSQLLP